jgi:phage baseplate assembly protein gpV
VSRIIPTLQALVRGEMRRNRGLALAQVTAVFTNEGGGGDHHLVLNARIRGSALELQKVPIAVGRHGLSAVPRVDDLVLVGFIDGDLNAPIVMGILYDESAAPPDASADEIVYAVPDEERDDARRLHMEMPNGNSITVTDVNVEITMGSTTMTIEADGAISLAAAGNIELSADGDVSIKAGGKVEIEAKQDTNVKGMNCNIEGQTGAKLKGANVTLAGNTSFSPT